MPTLEATTDVYELPPWDGQESDSVTIFALVATGLSWVAVGGRLFARRFWALGADDWLVIPATVNNCSLLPLPLFEVANIVYIPYPGALAEGGPLKGCGKFLICLVTRNGEYHPGVLCGLERRYWQAFVANFGRGVCTLVQGLITASLDIRSSDAG